MFYQVPPALWATGGLEAPSFHNPSIPSVPQPCIPQSPNPSTLRGGVYPFPTPDRETHPSLFSHVILRSLPSVVLFFAVREAKRSPKDAKRRQEAPTERQRDAKMGQRARQGCQRAAKGDQGRPKGGQGEAKRRQREAKGRPRGGQERPKGSQREAKERPRGGQERPKAAKAAQSLKRTSGYRVLGCQKPSGFGRKMKPKFSQSRKSDFLKTELSFESGAHFQREGQARPGQKGLAKPSQSQAGL